MLIARRAFQTFNFRQKFSSAAMECQKASNENYELPENNATKVMAMNDDCMWEILGHMNVEDLCNVVFSPPEIGGEKSIKKRGGETNDTVLRPNRMENDAEPSVYNQFIWSLTTIFTSLLASRHMDSVEFAVPILR